MWMSHLKVNSDISFIVYIHIQWIIAIFSPHYWWKTVTCCESSQTVTTLYRILAPLNPKFFGNTVAPVFPVPIIQVHIGLSPLETHSEFIFYICLKLTCNIRFFFFFFPGNRTNGTWAVRRCCTKDMWKFQRILYRGVSTRWCASWL